VWAGGAFRGSFTELFQEVRRRVVAVTSSQEPQILMLGAADADFPRAAAFHLDRRAPGGYTGYR
jgi:hypothetical protein